MIEFSLWVFTLFMTAYVMSKSSRPPVRAAGLAYLLVGIGACLGLYVEYDTQMLALILDAISNWWVLEVFIFLNIVTGYAFYESGNNRKPN